MHTRDEATDIVARFSGDEFGIILEDVKNIKEAMKVADRINNSLQKPIILNGQSLNIGVSIGIVEPSSIDQTADDLLRNADIAMYKAKYERKGKYALFDESMHETAVRRLRIERDLVKAIENQEFNLVYQPIIDVNQNKIISFEALIRWNHVDFGFIPPVDFIPLAEESGTIVPIGLWVLEKSINQLKQWNKLGYKDIGINVNLSPKQVDNEIVDSVKKVLTKEKISADKITLEITEKIIVKNIDSTLQIVKKFREMKVNISIDDFGVGYSSLNYLKELPINNIKIDRVFINDLLTDKNTVAIVYAIIAMAESLNLNVIAEGVETKQQSKTLLDMNCKLHQGYLYCKPIAPDMCTKFMEEWDNGQK